MLAVTALAARSVALAGFGLDSLIEIGASVVVVWELAGTGEFQEYLRREFPKQEYAERVDALRRRYNVLALHAWQFVENYNPNS